MVLSAVVGLFVSIANLWKPFPVGYRLLGELDFTTVTGVAKYSVGLVFILLSNVPLLYGGIATAFSFGNALTSGLIAFASAQIKYLRWGLYGFKNWATR